MSETPTQPQFRSGDTCTVLADWIESKDKNRRVRILGFQTNGNKRFARVAWIGRGGADTDLLNRYGNLFAEEELRKV